MRAWMSLKFGQIQPLVSMVTDRVMMEKTTVELAALECLKNPHRLIMGKTMLHFSLAVLDRILFILAGNDNIQTKYMRA